MLSLSFILQNFTSMEAIQITRYDESRVGEFVLTVRDFHHMFETTNKRDNHI